MAYKLSEFTRDLGSISFNDKEYEITKITTYESGNQVIELIDTSNGEDLQMTFWKPGY